MATGSGERGLRPTHRAPLVRGGLIVTGAGLMFAVAGASVKMAAADLPSGAIVFWRNAIGLVILLPWVIVRWPGSVRTANLDLMILRALAMLAAIYCYYFAVSAIPLADAVLLSFSSPLFVPLLGFLLYRFALDRTAFIAVAIGFVGVALIVKPGAGIIVTGALLGLAAGAFGALSLVSLWRMPCGESPVRVVFYLALINTVVSSFALPWVWQTPAPADWLPLIALGLSSTAAQILLAWGCLIAPADRVGPFQYSSIIFAALLGWAFWSESIDALMVVGAGLIIAASIFLTRTAPKRA